MSIIKVNIANILLEFNTSKNKWSSSDPEKTSFVRSISTLYNSTEEPSGSDPYPALTRIKELIKLTGGTIVDEGEPAKFRSDVEY
jgi:hypothetical protein